MKTTIKIHAQWTTTFTDVEVLERSQGWIRFKGTNDMGHVVIITTSLPVEITETT